MPGRRARAGGGEAWRTRRRRSAPPLPTPPRPPTRAVRWPAPPGGV